MYIFIMKKKLCFLKAFNIPNLDIHHSYLNKALITMIAMYLFYMRDQLSRIFLNIETVWIYLFFVLYLIYIFRLFVHIVMDMMKDP